MRVGVFTALLAQFSLDDVLKKLKKLNIDTVELGTGNYPGDPHCKLSMLDNISELNEFKKSWRKRFLHQRAELPWQPAASRTRPAPKHDQEVNRKTILLAEKLGVPVVIDFSGCPGDIDELQVAELGDLPLAAGLPGNPQVAVGEKVMPYWTERGKFAAGSRREDRHRNAPRLRGLQPGNDAEAARHRGPSDRLQLRSEPHVLAGHRSDCRHSRPGRLHFPCACQGYPDLQRNLPLTGVLDTKQYTDERNRAWIFRTCGYGHGAEWWKEFASTLRMFGYDYVLSIEHEDSLLSPEEGLTKAAEFLNGIVMREQPAAAWWV